MVVPPFQTKFTNIPSEMTTPMNLIQTFGGELFTGLLHVSFGNNHELIGLFEEGSLLSFIEEKENIRQKRTLQEVENTWKQNKGVITAYQSYPDEIFILEKLLTKKLTTRLEIFGLELGEKIVALKRKKENCIIEIDSKDKKQAIYLWEGKIIWNLSDKSIFIENKKVKARIYKGKKINYQEEMRKIKETIRELSKTYKQTTKRDFDEDFLFFIHKNLAEKFPVIDPFLGVFKLENSELTILEKERLKEFIGPFKQAISNFIEKEINLSPQEKENIINKLNKEEEND
ncbi:hypothetical protein [Thermodesulfatator autotrophicus]|uniref:DUF4388 domain-containing protein n=1 Tax=Thermodesulfatator autotrophicus TaxID=1795632 RepID=A0A177E7S2_9BACT|nr:hypothetical protein [Thermodesulfatator autotrophicus]OAG28003.1 hypothetical protein TH606_03985 [Thermodesulfatator autotrophicus]